VTVDSIEGVDDFPEYAKTFLLKGMKVLGPTELAKLLGVTVAEAQGIASQELAPGIELGDFVANALLAHYAGDEKADAATKAVIEGMIASTDSKQKMLGEAIYSIYADTTADNKFMIDLNTLGANVKEVPADQFSGTQEASKVHEGNITVNVSEIKTLTNAEVTGNLMLTGTVTEEINLSNIKVGGNLNLTEINSDKVDLTGIEVTGETTF